MWMSKSDQSLARMILSQPLEVMVGLTRLELVTPRLSSVCSNQLSYRPLLVKCQVENTKRQF